MRLRVVPVHYLPGGTWGQCQRCAFKYRLNELKLEWSGLRVCSECWDPLPDTMTPPVVYPEGLMRPDAAPEIPGKYLQALLTEGGIPITTEDGIPIMDESMMEVSYPHFVAHVTPYDLQPPGILTETISTEDGFSTLYTENGQPIMTEIQRVPLLTPFAPVRPEDL